MAGVQLPTNTIYQVHLTSKSEYVLATYFGMRFIDVDGTKVTLHTEQYFEGQNVLRICEYQPSTFVVCLAKDDHVYILKRGYNVI